MASFPRGLGKGEGAGAGAILKVSEALGIFLFVEDVRQATDTVGVESDDSGTQLFCERQCRRERFCR